ncbi:MAG: hypothetical protein ACRDD1_17925 [Planctomycetia bacterium]
MSDEPQRKAVKVGVQKGGGPPPGYRWSIQILDRAFDEAMSILDADQYDHIARQFRELASQEDVTHSDTVDVRPIEDFHELRDKGGVLKRLNVRVFFFVHKPTGAIVVLGAIKKENDGATPIGDKVTMRRRKRLFLESVEPHES